MDPDDPMTGLRTDVADTLAGNLLVTPQPPQTEGQAPAAAAPDTPASAPATAPSANDCEFTFIGGAGVGGPYLNSFKKAFDDAGIQHAIVPNYGTSAARMLDDLQSVPRVNDLAFAKSLVNTPEIKAAAEHSRSLGDEQYNLGGYSYGAAREAAKAYAIAQSGGKVDNLVLVGAPINQDLYDAVRQHPNIKNVVTMDLGVHGDPVHAGMSDLDFVMAAPQLGGQMFDPSAVGHFYYSKDGPVSDARREDLARTLVQRGVR